MMMSMVAMAIMATAAELCSNTCEVGYSFTCDDGGPGAEYDKCEYGTDCDSCGPRPELHPPPPLPPGNTYVEACNVFGAYTSVDPVYIVSIEEVTARADGAFPAAPAPSDSRTARHLVCSDGRHLPHLVPARAAHVP